MHGYLSSSSSELESLTDSATGTGPTCSQFHLVVCTEHDDCRPQLASLSRKEKHRLNLIVCLPNYPVHEQYAVISIQYTSLRVVPSGMLYSHK